MSGGRKDRAINAALSLGAMIFVLAGLESLALLNIVDYRIAFRNLGHQPWRNPLNRLDPELLHVHRPHQVLEGIQLGDISHYASVPEPSKHQFSVRIDQHGFRNEQDLNRADIAVLGDSFIESVLTPARSLLTTELARRTGRTVANLGQLWYAPQQELVVLKRYALPLEPKLIVWTFYGGNDLTDYRRYETALENWEETSAHYHNFYKRSLTRNVLSRIKHLVRPKKSMPPAQRGTCPFGAKRGPMYFFYPDVSLNQEDHRAFEATLGLLKKAQGLAAAKGAALLVLYAPTKYQAYRAHCDFPKDMAIHGWTGSGLAKRLEEAVRGQLPEAHFLDLTPALSEAISRGEQPYIVDDTHWSAAGNQAAAVAIFEHITARNLLK